MKKKKGFTLVELVIVIAIVIILSVVSVPIYRGYINKAKMAEGYALLGMVLSAQKAYYSEYGMFLHGYKSSAGTDNDGYTCNETVLGIDSRGNKYFTWFDVGRGIDSTNRDFIAYVLKPEDLVLNSAKPYLSLRYNITDGASFVDNVAFNG